MPCTEQLPITFVIKSMTYEQVFSKYYVLQLLENDAKVDKYLITSAKLDVTNPSAKKIILIFLQNQYIAIGRRVVLKNQQKKLIFFGLTSTKTFTHSVKN